METKRLEEYKKTLEKERVTLTTEIMRNEKRPDLGSDVSRPDEETDESEETGNQQAVAQDLKNRLGAIEAALRKIGTGDYGICEQCKKEIEPAILDIDPESRFCKHCKLGR